MQNAVIKTLIKLIVAAVAVMLAIFIILEIFISTYNPVKTELALMYTQEELLTVDGMVLREESCVFSSVGGVLDYIVEDGQKVAAGERIAYSYPTEEQARIYSRINEIDEQIEKLKNISTDNEYYVLDLEHIKKEITQTMFKISAANGSTGISDVYDSIDAFAELVTRKQVSTGIKVDFSEKIAMLNEEKAQLKTLALGNVKSVYAQSSGYFISEADGYENSVDISKLMSFTAAEYEAIAPVEVPSNAIGKLTDDYNWYYCFTASRFVAQQFSEGSEISLRLPESGAQAFPATVAKVNYTGDIALIILHCTYMSEDYALSRHQTLQVVCKTHDGLRVDRDAIRVNAEGISGVYVLIGVEVKFRRIDILYSCDEYVLAAPGESRSGSLMLYDYIITKGSGLYDGKLIYRQT